jgi:cobalt-precorrin-5B (C1)-methyltransferase
VDPAFSGVGPHVLVGGGRGVGVATLPGLPVAVGQAAINPGPMEQIRQSVLEVLPEGFTGIVLVVVEAPDGEDIARHTLNPRLGVAGGISILGTAGVVRPYSHEAWAECVRRSLDVARAAGHTCAALTTGRRSERLFLERHPGTPAVCLVQAADFFAEALCGAAQRGFATVVWCVFIGKLAKQAQGLANTHARAAALDFALLADWARRAGADASAVDAVAGANTAAQALALLPAGVASALAALLADRAKQAARAFAGDALDVRYVVFGLDGGVLYADEVPQALFSAAAPLHLETKSR